MSYAKLEKLNEAEFKRLTGVKKATFKIMKAILEDEYKEEHKSGGRPSRISIEQKLLMTLGYWREYRTYFHIGASNGCSESQAYRSIRWVENTLVKSGKFNLPGKGKLSHLDKSAILLVDVTESPIERPQKKAMQILLRKEEKAYAEDTGSSE